MKCISSVNFVLFFLTIFLNLMLPCIVFLSRMGQLKIRVTKQLIFVNNVICIPGHVRSQFGPNPSHWCKRFKCNSKARAVIWFRHLLLIRRARAPMRCLHFHFITGHNEAGDRSVVGFRRWIDSPARDPWPLTCARVERAVMIPP